MKIALRLAVGVLLIAVGNVSAAILYVSHNSLNPTAPYKTWATAATNIQDAVVIASAGDQIMVTNGVYLSGGRTLGASTLTNRVAVDKALTLQSANGPSVTVIQGYQLPGTVTGDAAIRCVYLASNAVISGFTLASGATRAAGNF